MDDRKLIYRERPDGVASITKETTNISSLKKVYTPKIWKNCRGLVINLPKAICMHFDVVEGDYLELTVLEDGTVQMCKKEE